MNEDNDYLEENQLDGDPHGYPAYQPSYGSPGPAGPPGPPGPPGRPGRDGK